MCAQAEGAFYSKLRNIVWCPVLEAPPVEGVPWPKLSQRLASPQFARPLKDLWRVSATMAIVDGDCRWVPCNAKCLSNNTSPLIAVRKFTVIGRL